tara:strand:- start:968 stop:1198 length:231 start_codon:yes stop_codon:yes gene_type:complete
LTKDGKCSSLGSREDAAALAELIAGYKETFYEGESANAVRSQISMDGTLDNFARLGGALSFTNNLATSLGVESSQV